MVNPENIIVRRYDGQHYSEDGFSPELSRPHDSSERVWIDVTHQDDLYAMHEIEPFKSLHPLLLENLHAKDQRSRLEIHDQCVVLVTHLVEMKDGHLNSQQVTLLLFEDRLFSISEKPHQAFEEIKKRLKNPSDALRKRGLDFLLYTILDDIVDDFNGVLDEVTERIDECEGKMLSTPSLDMMNAMQEFKKTLFVIYRKVWPLREILNRIVHEEVPYMDKAIALYHRDVLDHLFQLLDVIDLYREIISSMMDVYLSSLSIRMNEIMKVLTIISTIFMPLTFIVGLYGMNFKYIPEFDYPYAYPLVLAAMSMVTLGMVMFFKHKKWW